MSRSFPGLSSHPPIPRTTSPRLPKIASWRRGSDGAGEAIFGLGGAPWRLSKAGKPPAPATLRRLRSHLCPPISFIIVSLSAIDELSCRCQRVPHPGPPTAQAPSQCQAVLPSPLCIDLPAQQDGDLKRKRERERPSRLNCNLQQSKKEGCRWRRETWGDTGAIIGVMPQGWGDNEMKRGVIEYDTECVWREWSRRRTEE